MSKKSKKRDKKRTQELDETIDELFSCTIKSMKLSCQLSQIKQLRGLQNILL